MLRKLKQWFIENFEFNRQQLRGMIVLSALIMILLVIRLLPPYFKSSDKEDLKMYAKKIDEFHKNLRQKESQPVLEGALFFFDPNDLPDAEWQRLGLSERQIGVIKRYEAKGGEFHSKDDLKKMYCIPEEQFARLEPYIRIENRDSGPSVSRFSEPSARKINPFPFNPNDLTEQQWLKLGLSEKQVAVIKKYESKGGKFRKKEDLKKMYVISEEEYTRLEPFIEIPADTISSGLKKYEKANGDSKPDIRPVEINTADSAELVQLPGIGPAFASRIIKYREKLGGFYSSGQLNEIYGMDSIKLNNIKPYLFVDEKRIRKIHINNIEFKELMKHPYFNYTTVKAIFELKNKKGFIAGIGELKTIPLMHQALYNKITPYLTTD